MKKIIVFLNLFFGILTNVYSQIEYKTDTIISKVIIDNVSFTLKVLRDKHNDHMEEFGEEDEGDLHYSQSPITLTFIRNEDSKVIYSKKIDTEINDYPYLNYFFYKSQNKTLSDYGRLYMSINKSYGGSGSTTVLYTFTFDGKNISVNKIDSFGELTYVLHGKDDYEILFLTGKWNEGESHFENHQYIIKKIQFGKSIEVEYLGTTEKKYPSLDDINLTSKKLFDLIYKNEPRIFRSIDLYNFKY